MHIIRVIMVIQIFFTVTTAREFSLNESHYLQIQAVNFVSGLVIMIRMVILIYLLQEG